MLLDKMKEKVTFVSEFCTEGHSHWSFRGTRALNFTSDWMFSTSDIGGGVENNRTAHFFFLFFFAW